MLPGEHRGAQSPLASPTEMQLVPCLAKVLRRVTYSDGGVEAGHLYTALEVSGIGSASEMVLM